MSESKRPASLAMPTVWARFRGQRAMGDGRVPDFWVQCVRPEDDAAVEHLMEHHFLPEETSCSALGTHHDAEAIVEAHVFWKSILEQRVSLAAWTDWPDGTPRLIGCNLLHVKSKSDPIIELQTPILRTLMRELGAFDDDAGMFERHGVSEYLSGMGLITTPEFRGQGLGIELLRARVPLCRALGLRVTGTLFTGTASQKQSARAGFQMVARKRYADFVHGGEQVFKNVKDVEAVEYKELVIPESG